MNFEEIDEYCNKHNVDICYENFSPCPCRITILNEQFSFCNFVKVFAKYQIIGDSNKIENLLNKVCPKIRNEVFHHDYRAKQLRKQKEKFLGNVKFKFLMLLEKLNLYQLISIVLEQKKYLLKDFIMEF